MRLMNFAHVGRGFRKAMFQNLFPAVLAVSGLLEAAPAAPPGSATIAPLVDVYLVLQGDPASVTASGAVSAPQLESVSARTKLRSAELAAQHAALQPRIEAAGGLVRTHYTRLLNAIKVRISSDKLPALAALPGVRRVFKVRQFKRALTHSVPFIGTPAAWSLASPAADGAGVRIGIIDTGIDYTHADFGGPGTASYYNSLDPTTIQPGVFPTAKVAGGYDLAGDSYDAGDPNNSIPIPDPNPLDCEAGGGHGTHVSGIAAGFGVLTNGQTYSGPYSSSLNFNQFQVGPGVAPGALLYAIKVFSCVPDGTTDLIPDALEWASDPDGDGNFSDRLDVVNLSLGSTFGDNDPEDPNIVAANNLARLGCVVVCAAGNDGNVFYALSSPGSASSAIAAANSVGPQTGQALRVLSPAAIAGDYYSIEGGFTLPLAASGPVTGNLVYVQPNDACSTITNAAAIRGNIALIDRGTCLFVDKVQAAQDDGAKAVVVVDNQVEIPFSMGGSSSTINIPGVMISKANGALIKSNLAAGVRVTLNASNTVSGSEFADTLDGGSSRGPVELAPYLKPEIAAPGTDIYSAAAGTGTNGISFSGTSMASPHIAGAAAILRQLHPSWSVEEIKAGLMNTAVTAHDLKANPYPESLQGAGRVQVDKAAETEATVAAANAGGNVALGFGSLVLAAPFQTNATIVLSNHGSNTLAFEVAVSNTLPQAGVTLAVGVSSVTLPPQSSTNLTVTFSANPALFNLQPDATTPLLVDGDPQQFLYEASGQIWFLGPAPIHLPYHAALRAASAFHAATNTINLPAASGTNQLITFTVPMSGSAANTNLVVSAFELGTTLDNFNLLDPFESEADLIAVGAASDIATAGSLANATVFFGIATASDWAAPQPGILQLQVNIDLTGDGYPNFTLVNGTLNDINADASALDVFITTAQGFDNSGNLTNTFSGGFLNHYTAAQKDTAPYDNSVLVESIPVSQLGLTPGASSFRYQVFASGFFTNVAQTGWITYDPGLPTLDTAANSPDGAPFWTDGQPIRVTLNRAAATIYGQHVPSVLLLHHHNLQGSRVDVVHVDLPGVDFTASPPTFQQVTQTGTTLKLIWSAASGHTYQLQFKSALTQPAWSVLTSVTATNSIAGATDVVVPGAMRFYRVALTQ
jgi:subtilisin family serine protease